MPPHTRRHERHSWEHPSYGSHAFRGTGAPPFTSTPREAFSNPADLFDQLTRGKATQAALRREVANLKRHLAAQRAAADTQRAHLKAERAHRQALLQEIDALHEEIASLQAAHEKEFATPGAHLLRLPLVIRNAHNEFLGVTGHAKPFSLGDFLDLVEQGGHKRQAPVAMVWQRRAATWMAQFHAKDPHTGHARQHGMVVAPITTPRGNRVMHLARLTRDGVDAPEPFLRVLFQKIKAELAR